MVEDFLENEAHGLSVRAGNESAPTTAVLQPVVGAAFRVRWAIKGSRPVTQTSIQRSYEQLLGSLLDEPMI